MTVETTVQWMFDHYPDLYSTREECFDHLFCTIGNGYEWKWGQLVYHDRGDPDYDDYNRGRLLFAARVLPYINRQEGLFTTHRHPFYQ